MMYGHEKSDLAIVCAGQRSEVAAIRTRLWLQCRQENGPAASEPCPQKRMSASWSGPYMGSTEYKRGSRAIARGQWQAPLGSSRGEQADHGRPAAVLALVKDKPSAALKKRRP